MRYGHVSLSAGQRLRYEVCWDGKRPLSGGRSPHSPIAYDVETEVIDDDSPTPPRVALATATDGNRVLVVRPEHVARFWLLHKDRHVVGHNVVFDFRATDHLLSTGVTDGPQAREALWRCADGGRLHDTMLFDMLLVLGRRGGGGPQAAKYELESGAADDSSLRPRNLAVVAREYAGITYLDKEDPYRTRYGELLGLGLDDFAGVPEQFFSYAAKDSYATWHTYGAQYAAYRALAGPLRKKLFSLWCDPDCEGKYGPLTETLQVRASVAVEYMKRRGLKLDQSRVLALESRVRGEVERLVAEVEAVDPKVFSRLKEHRKYDGDTTLWLFGGTKDGLPPPLPIKRTAKTGAPQFRQKALTKRLAKEAARAGIEPPASSGKTQRAVSLSAKDWQLFKGRSPFLAAWCSLAKQIKLLSYFPYMRDKEYVRPNYGLLKATGRTSSYGPNLQQWPRDGAFRAPFVARPGFKIVTIDYKYVELRTLAAVCKKRFGFSRLADVIAQGIDPHEYTASLVSGVSLADIRALKSSDEAAYKKLRQPAKAVNFGVPGGLGDDRLADYALLSYGVPMTVEEAHDLREKLINDVYPELKIYLGEDLGEALSSKLGVSRKKLEKCLGLPAYGGDPETMEKQEVCLKAVMKILKGRPFKKDGTPYKPQFIDKTWRGLASLVRSASNKLPHKHVKALEERRPSKGLAAFLFARPVLTMTGRVRAGATFTQARNTPFQGLASDGGKLALWRLTRDGHRVVGFVHDEVLVEVPEEGADSHAREVDRVLCESMADVMCNLVPAECEYVVSDKWEK